MGIENEIKELREEMAALRGVLEAVLRDAEFYRDGGPADGDDADGCIQTQLDAADPTPAPAPVNEKKEESPSLETPTRHDVSSLCMGMVRDGKVSKKEMLEIFAEFDGARSVKEVPDASIPDLYARLKGMV